MSDATDAVAEAIARNRRLAASCSIREGELEAEVATIQKDRAAATEPELVTQLDARLATANTNLLAATQDYQAALAELAKLEQLGHQARRVEARVIVDSVHGDPLIRSNEQIALDNVREHLAGIDAEGRLDAELTGRARTPPAAPPSKEAADAAARLEFEALRAKRQEPPADPSAAPAPKPKKTL